MNKKMGLIFLFFVLAMGAMYAFTMSKTLSDEADKSNNNVTSSPTSNSKKEKNIIGDINDVKLYFTDYKYDSNINGYHYTLLQLTEGQIQSLKEQLKDIDLNSTTSGIVYGQYELVIDSKKIFFDINNDYALYLDENKTFVLPRNIKNIVANTTNTCSCCTTLDCKINLCECVPLN